MNKRHFFTYSVCSITFFFFLFSSLLIGDLLASLTPTTSQGLVSPIATSTTNIINSSSDTTYMIPVGKAELLKEKIVILPPVSSSSKESDKTIEELFNLFNNDFSFYQTRFSVTDYRSYKLPSLQSSPNFYTSPDYTYWKEREVQYLVTLIVLDKLPQEVQKISLKPEQSPVQPLEKQIYVQVTLYNISKGITLYQKVLILNGAHLREIGHLASSELYMAITNKTSIFKSKIYFVSDRTSDWSNRKISKELYVMDFDGHNIEKLTNHQGIVLSPALSYNNKLLIYSLIKEVRGKKSNVDLYMLNLETKQSSLISSLEGINSGASFSPINSDIIVLTLSYDVNADIYEFNLKTKERRKLTTHPGLDVDPSYSKDGHNLAFVSSRPGKGMLYLLDPSGTEKEVKRLSFIGDNHATPKFSPTYPELIFSSWIDHGFDIYRIGLSGYETFRLTKNFGSNEGAYFSNDGEFIVFSSQRIISRNLTVKNLYIMTREGDIIGSVTSNLGNCTSPIWDH